MGLNSENKKGASYFFSVSQSHFMGTEMVQALFRKAENEPVPISPIGRRFYQVKCSFTLRMPHLPIGRWLNPSDGHRWHRQRSEVAGFLPALPGPSCRTVLSVEFRVANEEQSNKQRKMQRRVTRLDSVELLTVTS